MYFRASLIDSTLSLACSLHGLLLNITQEKYGSVTLEMYSTGSSTGSVTGVELGNDCYPQSSAVTNLVQHCVV
jgi:hypothetical protein